MAIELTARIVVTKAELQAAGVDTTEDDRIAAEVGFYLKDRLPQNWDASGLTVGIRRKVQKDNTNA